MTLLTALGAWLAAVPLLLFAGLMLGSLFTRGVGPYLVGAVATVAAVKRLRHTGRSVFQEQLAVPGLLVGLGALGFGLGRDIPAGAAAFVMALCVLGCSVAVMQGWLRTLLGAAVPLLLAIAGMMALSPRGEWTSFTRAAPTLWAAWHLLGAAGLVSLGLQRRVAQAEHALWLEQVGTGWLLAVTAALAWLSGMTFLAGAALGPRDSVSGLIGEFALRSLLGAQPVPSAVSALCAFAAAVCLMRRWPALRQPALGVLALAAAGLAALMTSLGGSLLIAAACAATGRRRRALAALLASVWILGAFYYAVQATLATKALVLMGVGLVAGVSAWRLRRVTPVPKAASPPPAPAGAAGLAALLPLAALAVVAISGWAVWQKEQLLALGRPAFVELAPVDPRSLMQGDYMTLRWRLPADVRQELDRLETSERPLVAARRDERQVLTLTHIVDAVRPLAAGEEVVQLSPKSGRWVIVTDAWFFRDGEAARWQRARYGEFRLLPDGRALLVGLRGADLQPL